MTAEEVAPASSERGLFLHAGAQRAIEAFVRLKQVGAYPMYLVGLALPEHRGGPALVAVLTLADGGVVDAHARSLPKTRGVNGVLDYDVEFVDGAGLDRYRRTFYEDYGGFLAAGCLDSSPVAVAERMLAHARAGFDLAPTVGPSPLGPPVGYPSDWTDVVYYTQGAVGCTVEGFAPSADAVDDLDIPDSLKRAMQLATSPRLDWLEPLEERLATEVHPLVPGLVAEAWAVRLVSRRASVALLRSVAELMVTSLVPQAGGRFHDKLLLLEQQWKDAPATPDGRREIAWRSVVLSCLHTVRDLGNRIHAESVVTRADLDLAHHSNRRLLEAVMRAGPLDAVTST